MIENIGLLLKNTRLEKNLELIDIATKTNININVLQKLEENRFNEISAPVFIKGYLKLYAKALDLDQQTVNEILNHSFGSNPELQLSSAVMEGNRRSLSKRNWSAWLTLSAFIGIILLLLSQVFVHDSWLMTQIRATFPSQEVSQEALPSEEIQITVNDLTTSVESKNPGTISLESQAENTTISEPSNLENDKPKIVLESTQDVNNSNEPNNPSAENNSINEALSQEITLEFTGRVWVHITNAKKKTVHSGTFDSGKTLQLNAEDAPFSINLGRPEAVILKVGGKETDWASIRSAGNKNLYKVNL